MSSNSSDSAPSQINHLPVRAIKSYVRRAGRVTIGQQRAIDTVGQRFLVPYINLNHQNAALTEVTALFGAERTDHPLVFEIGFGMGEATSQIAQTLPDANFLCAEVHEAGVGALLKRIADNQINNIRICAHDAVEIMDNMLMPASLDGIHIFFPDPWHKARHGKRRLIQSPFIAKLASRLKPGGYLHCATDWEPYAKQMLEVLQQEVALKNRFPSDQTELFGFAPKPSYRPLTKFENRGLKLGHGVWDLVFERI